MWLQLLNVWISKSYFPFVARRPYQCSPFFLFSSKNPSLFFSLHYLQILFVDMNKLTYF